MIEDFKNTLNNLNDILEKNKSKINVELNKINNEKLTIFVNQKINEVQEKDFDLNNMQNIINEIHTIANGSRSTNK